MSTKAKDSSLQKGGGNMMDKVRRAGILGTGRYVPEKGVTNDDLSVMMESLFFPMNPVRLHTLLVL
jgi:hypothetical protein